MHSPRQPAAPSAPARSIAASCSHPLGRARRLVAYGPPSDRQLDLLAESYLRPAPLQTGAGLTFCNRGAVCARLLQAAGVAVLPSFGPQRAPPFAYIEFQ